LVLCTLVFEGTENDTNNEEKICYAIADRHGGVRAGAENGKRGFKLTFVIAYIREFCLKHNIIGESFETCVPWDKIKTLVTRVKSRINKEARAAGCFYKPFVSFRIT